VTASGEVVLDVDGLRMRFGTNDVLRGVTFEARHGDRLTRSAWAVRGPSSS
jgi:ABC-2 type transport system ATP-binding protein